MLNFFFILVYIKYFHIYIKKKYIYICINNLLLWKNTKIKDTAIFKLSNFNLINDNF
jgi:hypothetical protein